MKSENKISWKVKTNKVIAYGHLPSNFLWSCDVLSFSTPMVKPIIPPKHMLFLSQPEPPIIISIHLYITSSLSSLLSFADSLSFSTGAMIITAGATSHDFRKLRYDFYDMCANYVCATCINLSTFIWVININWSYCKIPTSTVSLSHGLWSLPWLSSFACWVWTWCIPKRLQGNIFFQVNGSLCTVCFGKNDCVADNLATFAALIKLTNRL